MAQVQTNNSCCGVMDISDLHVWKKPETALKQILKSSGMVRFSIYEPSSGRYLGYGKGYENPGGTKKLETPQITPLRNAYGMFSGVQKEQYAQRFAAFLKREKLGRVVKAHAAYNPNHPERVGKSGGKLLVYLWTIDHPALEKWIQTHIKREEDLSFQQEDQNLKAWDWDHTQPRQVDDPYAGDDYYPDELDDLD